jgi:hypothetical protein
MQLSLLTFSEKNKYLTKQEKKAITIAQTVRLEGPIADDEQLTQDFLNIMDKILKNYIMDKEWYLLKI